MNTQQIIARTPFCLLGLLGLTLFPYPVSAQVFDFGPSDPALFDNVINVPSDPDIGDGESIGLDDLVTQVNISDGGLVGVNFDAYLGEVNVSGGEVGNFFSANSLSEVNISGGEVGIFFDANSGSQVNISGGIVGNGFEAFAGSVVNVSGGSVGSNFDAFSGSEVNISGGTFGTSFDANGPFGDDPGSVVNISGGSFELFNAEGGVVNISGGSFGDGFDSGFGSVLNISGGSFGDDFDVSSGEVNLFGGEFALDGVPLEDLTMGEAFTIVDRGQTLSGLFADRSEFNFDLNVDNVLGGDFFDSDVTLTVTLVEVPPAPIVGDVNQDLVVSFEDVPSFISVLISGVFQFEADVDKNGVVDFADIPLFIEILTQG